MKPRKDRAKKCLNMHDGGFCGSICEGAENRMCYILEPREIFEDGGVVDYCPFHGTYGYRVKKEGEVK